MGQNISSETPAISIDDCTLEVVQEFTYLRSIITSNPSLNVEINKHIGKAASVMSRLPKWVWENNMLTKNIKVGVYQACVLRTLFYGSETWTTYAKQENASVVFTFDASDAYLASPGGNTYQTRMSSSMQTSPVCSPC